MNLFMFQVTPIVLLAWLVWTLCSLVALGQSSGLSGVIRLLSSNTIILGVFCGVWYWGFYMSEDWTRIIDAGAPWTWLGALFGVSFMVSFWLLRKYPKAVAKSLMGPLITLPVFLLWMFFCGIQRDPYW
jgi:hypothetical protein